VRFDASWVHGRDQNPEAATLRAKKVMIIGLGSVGSSVADLLVKAGVGKVALVDPEALASANGSRHLLGATAVGVNKAAAVGQNLASRFPHLEGTAFAGQFTDAQQPIITSLRSADLILSLSGNWPAESLLDTIWRADSDLPPIVYGWTEPHAAAGHALVLMQDGGCLRCVLSDMGKARLPVTIWTENTLLQIPACGDMFQPYGATELAHIQALIAELALDVLLQRVADSTHRVWIGRHDLLTRAGGSWDPAWIAAYGDPGGGGQLRDIQFNAGCAECDTA
jgi:molybdopterin/thiamine biosynthesis adenylyltransferase